MHHYSSSVPNRLESPVFNEMHQNQRRLIPRLLVFCEHSMMGEALKMEFTVMRLRFVLPDAAVSAPIKEDWFWQ
ncbi:hypothetical protein AVEN_207907-1, partial [Araneus ventricosus]